MFKNLKDKITTQVTKTNQTILSNILSTDSTSLSSFGIPSFSSRDENDENNRSRLDSSASDISQIANYASPIRQSIPPSDIESEHGADESDHETTSKMQKLLQTYKNKFTQLKKAYDEVEHERDNIKDMLQKYQDAAIKRKAELREQLKAEKQANDQLQLTHQKELKFRDQQIVELIKNREENQNLHKKISKLETTLARCEEEIQIHQEKRAELIIEREDLLQKQATIKDRRASVDTKLLQDKERLQEELESTRVYVRQLEADLQSTKEQQSETYERLTSELQETKQAKDDLQSLLEKTQQQEQTGEKLTALEKTLVEREEEINRLQELVAEQTKTLNQSKEESSLQIQLEHFKSQLENSNSLCEQFQAELEEKQKKDVDFSAIQNEQNERYSQLELQFKQILSEKSDLENQLDQLHSQTQANDQILQLEQIIKEFEIERDASRKEIETLKSEILSLINLDEENTIRIDEFANEKFNFEQELSEKDRQIIERNEQIHEIQSTLEQTKESNEKLRRALQKMKESLDNAEQDQTFRLQKLMEEYEQRLKTQEIEYDEKLKAMAKEMSVQIEEKERNYQQQLQNFIQNNQRTENELVKNSEERVINAEQRALVAEEHMSKMDEQLKEKQLDHYRLVQELQSQIQTLTKEKILTTEQFSQTIIEDMDHSSHLVESTEFDYLKQIVLAYMTGTDRLTMVKVICAVLRYTEAETLSIIEHEKFRQSRWLNSSR